MKFGTNQESGNNSQVRSDCLYLMISQQVIPRIVDHLISLYQFHMKGLSQSTLHHAKAKL